MDNSITINLSQQETNILLQLLDKSPITGIKGMRIVLGMDAKIRGAIQAKTADMAKDNTKPVRSAAKRKDNGDKEEYPS